MTKILTLGGANLDMHIKALDNIVKEDSNPASVSYSAGGVVRNIAENLALLGYSPVFLGAVGNDSNGKFLTEYSSACGIDMSRVFISSHPTSCYIDFLQPSGEMYVAANDMEIVNDISEDYLISKKELFDEADILAADANLPENIINKALLMAEKCRIFADGTSAFKVIKFRNILYRIYLLKVNTEELSALSGMPADSDDEIKAACTGLFDKGLYSICVSLGKRGCYYADNEGMSFFKALNPLECVQNVTGCGDSMMAGLISGYAEHGNKFKMVMTGLACGKITAASPESINRKLSRELIEKELSDEL